MFAGVDIGVTESPTITAEKEETNFGGLRFIFQKWACASRFQWGIFNINIVWPRKTNFLGGRIISKLARQ